MKQAELLALVKQMRLAQKSYFRERSPQWLSASKELERRVDKAIADAENKQPTLFE